MLAERGWNVGISDIDEANLMTAYDAVAAKGKCHAVVGDIAVFADVERCVDTFERELGPLDGLINNALHANRASLLEITEEEFRRTIDVGVVGYFLCAQAVARRMVKRQYGRIINMSSASGEYGVPSTIGYGSAKGAVNAMTRIMAAELGASNVTVNTMTTGPVDTSVFRRISGDDSGVKARLDRLPINRFGRVEDFIDIVVYLLSPASGWTTGALFRVDGGAFGCTLVQTK